MNYYNVLGLHKSASNDEIKKAYKSLAMKFHPDKNKEPDAINKFKDISEAYQILSDPNKRQEYDYMGKKNSHMRWRDPFEVFNEMFAIINHLHNTFNVFDMLGPMMHNSVVTVHVIDLNDYKRKHKNSVKIEEVINEPKIAMIEDNKQFKKAGNVFILNDNELDTIISKTVKVNKE